MSLPTALDSIIREATRQDMKAGTIGRMVTVKTGLFGAKTYLISNPGAACPLPVADVTLSAWQDLPDLTYAITCSVSECLPGYEDHLARVFHATPQFGATLSEFIRTTVRSEAFTKGGNPDEWARSAQDAVRTAYGLLSRVSVRLKDCHAKEQLLIADLVVRAKPRDWKKLIEVRHSLRLDLVNIYDWIRAEKPEMEAWCNKVLHEEMNLMFFDKSIIQIIEGFTRKGDDSPGTMEDELRRKMADKALSVGYRLEMFSAQPDIGLREFQHGFPVSAKGQFATKDSINVTFGLEIEATVKFTNLSDAVGWLDEGQDRLSTEKASEDIRRVLKDTVGTKLKSESTRRLFLALTDDFGDLNALEPELAEKVKAELLTRYRAQVTQVIIRQDSQDRFREFYKNVETLSGKVEIRTRRRAEASDSGEMHTGFTQLIEADYHVMSICQDDGGFMAFFSACFHGLKEHKSVKETLEKRLSSGAGEVLSFKDHKQLMPADMEEMQQIKNDLFSATVTRIKNELGVRVIMDAVVVTRPKLMDDFTADQEKDFMDTMRDARRRIADARGKGLPETDPIIENQKRILSGVQKQLLIGNSENRESKEPHGDQPGGKTPPTREA